MVTKVQKLYMEALEKHGQELLCSLSENLIGSSGLRFYLLLQV